MIVNLSISGLAIIDSLSIDFSAGFNVITGETGAGKSILIRALNLLMGAKANSETVRQGFPQAVISGTFSVAHSHPAVLMAGNLGIPIDESEKRVTLIVRRQVTAKGKSQSWVNDTPVTATVCRDLGRVLVDVFGQHENQRLLDLSSHNHYLDSFLKDSGILKRLSHWNDEVGESVKRLGQHLNLLREKERDRDYLAFRLEHVQQFEPAKEDYERLFDLKTRAKDQIELRDAMAGALGFLNAAQGESLAVLLKSAARSLSKANLPALEPLADRALQLAEEVNDLNYEIDKQLASLDFDEDEIEQARTRLQEYNDLFRKHGVASIEELLASVKQIEEDLTFLTKAKESLTVEMDALDKLVQSLSTEAKQLTEARKVAAVQIKKRVESELQDLAMKGASFGVQFHESRRALPALSFSAIDESLERRWKQIQAALSLCTESGSERAEFLLSSNPGEQELPLARIASGGELSRIMLALKKALAADADTCVLVFDEIDSGISGRVADVVGRKMQDLASDFQVLCISHLPQVAVYADTHFLVRKKEKGSRTETSIIALTDEQSAREIARLLSGEEVSKTSLANAESLITKARSKKTKTIETRL